MTEATSHDDGNEDAISTELETIGDEYDIHREGDEKNAAYAARIEVELENMIDELRACRDYVRELISEDE